MPARYVIDRQDCTVRTVFSGVLTRNEVVEHAKKLRADPDFDPAFSELVDLTEASEVRLGLEDFRMLALVDPFHPKSKRAFVVLSDAIFVFSVKPTKVFAFAKGHISHTRHQF